MVTRELITCLMPYPNSKLELHSAYFYNRSIVTIFGRTAIDAARKANKIAKRCAKDLSIPAVWDLTLKQEKVSRLGT
jgi:hypothetical protein